jgi:hypothetical protein
MINLENDFRLTLSDHGAKSYLKETSSAVSAARF